MAQKGEKNDRSEVSGETYRLRKLESRKDAKRIIDFFLSENSFEDRNFTGGEIIQLNTLPLKSLKDPNLQFWYVENAENEIVGAINLRENEERTGGYFIDFIAVDKQNRSRGIAIQLMDVVIEQVRLLRGRYMHANTCDTFYYESARKVFGKYGFTPVGHLPDYYFEGEGMIIYYKKM